MKPVLVPSVGCHDPRGSRRGARAANHFDGARVQPAVPNPDDPGAERVVTVAPTLGVRLGVSTSRQDSKRWKVKGPPRLDSATAASHHFVVDRGPIVWAVSEVRKSPEFGSDRQTDDSSRYPCAPSRAGAVNSNGNRTTWRTGRPRSSAGRNRRPPNASRTAAVNSGSVVDTTPK